MGRIALAAFLSLGIAVLGLGGLYLGLTDEWPLLFAVLVASCFVGLAIWNVATLERTSPNPEGHWLEALSTLAFATGAVGLLYAEGLGFLFLGLGAVGIAAAVLSKRGPGR